MSVAVVMALRRNLHLPHCMARFTRPTNTVAVALIRPVCPQPQMPVPIVRRHGPRRDSAWSRRHSSRGQQSHQQLQCLFQLQEQT